MPGEGPTLTRGSHRDPGAGCCLMEHVSTLAGEPFGPLPRCTHPVLAGLAALVNDRVSDVARATLVDRAPALCHARSRDPALTWRLVELAARDTLAHAPSGELAGAATRRVRRAARARRVRERVLPPVVVARLPRWVPVVVALAAADELVAAAHGLLAASGPAGSAARDRALIDLLDAAIAVTLGAAPRRSARPDDAPRRSARPDDAPRRSARPGSALGAAPSPEEVPAA